MSANNFKKDDAFSKKMDEVLGKYWERLAFEGRYIFTNSMMLQKKLGIDIILQMGSNSKEITIDTKHVRGNYKRLFLEAMSCTVEAYGLKEGWGIKEEGTPDYIMHVMHEHCQRVGDNYQCKYGDNCHACSYDISHITTAYITPAKNILNWYRPKYLNGTLQKTNEHGYHRMSDRNRTDGHNIDISIMMKEMGTKVCRLTQKGVDNEKA